jgi:hypothetical protein
LYNTRIQPVNLDLYIVPTMGFWLYNTRIQTVNLDLYIVPTILMFKYQKDQSIKTEFIVKKHFPHNDHNIPIP